MERHARLIIRPCDLLSCITSANKKKTMSQNTLISLFLSRTKQQQQQEIPTSSILPKLRRLAFSLQSNTQLAEILYM
jgi:hypothetical protein